MQGLRLEGLQERNLSINAGDGKKDQEGKWPQMWQFTNRFGGLIEAQTQKNDHQYKFFLSKNLLLEWRFSMEQASKIKILELRPSLFINKL